MDNVIILSSVRTPIGVVGGTLKDVPVYRLAALVLNETVKRTRINAAQVDDIVLASAYQSSENVTVVRMASLEARWAESRARLHSGSLLLRGARCDILRCHEDSIWAGL